MTTDKPYAHIPPTISPEAQELLRMLPDPHTIPPAPGPTEFEKWKALQEASIATTMEQRTQPVIDLLEPELTEMDFGGVPVLEMKPKGWQDIGKVIVFTHGGGYTQQSALSSFPQGGQVAHATGTRVLGVDYTLAPHAKWREVTGQVELAGQYTRGQTVVDWSDRTGRERNVNLVLEMDANRLWELMQMAVM